MKTLGIVNITRDSFSDGGRYFDPDAAIAHARQLIASGADYVDLGAESTHPDAEDVSAEEEIARLTPVIAAIKRERVAVSVDTHKPAVMRAVLALGIDMINDVTALRDPESVAVLRDAEVPVILMHSTAAGARAERREVRVQELWGAIRAFFEERLATLAAAGVARERLILDPGMGFFLGAQAELSLVVLRNLGGLKSVGCPVCISTSRKSFLGSLLGENGVVRPVAGRAAGTLASELWAALQGADYIRTHDVRAIRDALQIWRVIADAGTVR